MKLKTILTTLVLSNALQTQVMATVYVTVELDSVFKKNLHTVLSGISRLKEGANLFEQNYQFDVTAAGVGIEIKKNHPLHVTFNLNQLNNVEVMQNIKANPKNFIEALTANNRTFKIDKIDSMNPAGSNTRNWGVLYLKDPMTVYYKKNAQNPMSIKIDTPNEKGYKATTGRFTGLHISIAKVQYSNGGKTKIENALGQSSVAIHNNLKKAFDKTSKGNRIIKFKK